MNGESQQHFKWRYWAILSGFWSSLTAGVAKDGKETGSWISAGGAHPRLLNAVRSPPIWLYDDTDPTRGPFLGSYVKFGSDTQGPIGEYDTAGVRCFPTHFWDGEDEPGYSPRGIGQGTSQPGKVDNVP